MRLSILLPAFLLGLASVAAGATPDLSTSGTNAPAIEAGHGNKPLSNLLKVKRPKTGAQVTGKSIGAIFQVGNQIDTNTLRVYLNGKDVTPSTIDKGRCDAKTCEVTVKLDAANGLRGGKNLLRVHAYGFDKHIELQRVSFDYLPGRRGGQNVQRWLPNTVGLTLTSLSNPWVTITTGTPASLVDPIDQSTYSIPYADTQFPPSGTTVCSTPLQILVLDRTLPVQMAPQNGYQCVSTQAELASVLSSLTSADLVIVGSTGFSIPTGLNTTSIGGTDYSNLPEPLYPLTYAIIGVPGAPAGTAFENYSVPNNQGAPFQYPAFATGLLTWSENGNYDFHPGDNVAYSVTAGTTAATTSVSIGSQTHTPAPGSQDGFWVLTLDRMYLQPNDANRTENCKYGAATTSSCGTFYPTGSSDSTTAAQAIAALGSGLMSVDPRNLVMLMTVGKPFQSASAITSTLQAGFMRMGGVRYTLQSLVPTTEVPNPAYVLIAPGATSDRSPFDPSVVNSSSTYTQQNELGAVSGVLARNLISLYTPAVSSQTDGAQNAPGGARITPDPAFYQITSQLPQNWPLTDTSGHIAAYHYASGFFLQSHYPNIQPPYNQDVRYYYSSPTYPVWQYNADFAHCSDTPLPSTCPPYPSNTTDFTQADLNAAVGQLYIELSALAEANNYLGDNGIGGAIRGANGGGNIALSMINATYTVLDGQFAATENTPVSMSPSQWMNLVAGLLAIPAAGLGPLDLPVAGAAMGVASGALWTGSAAANIFNPNAAAPPSYENKFDTTLGQLSSGASDTYGPAVIAAYDTSLDMIYSDWGKLNAVYQKTSNSGTTGWYFDNNLELDSFENLLTAGVRRSLYLQLLPQFFQLDTYAAQPITDITKLGMLRMTWEEDSQYLFQCFQSYPNVTNTSYGLGNYLTPSGSRDMFVIGGPISNQNQDNVSEELPSSSLLDTLFAPVPANSQNPDNYLNLPADPFYSSNQTTGGLLVYRPGPIQASGVQCYKPGCVTEGYDDDKFCIGP